VEIRIFAHKGVKRLYMEDNAKGVPPDAVDKLRKMLAYLDNMEDVEEFSGDRKGTWSLSVTRNRRLTFRIDVARSEIRDVDLEDYH
jgi:proteic killer suppression protein